MVNKKCQQDAATWGKYQLRLSSMLILSAMYCGMLVFLIVFTSYEPKHRCYIPEIDGTENFEKNTTDIEPDYWNDKLYLFIPKEKNGSSDNFCSCSMYNQSTRNSTISPRENTTTCVHGYVFEKSGKESAVTEWQLICDSAWIKPLTSSLLLSGLALSSLTTGWISDRYGRKKIFLLAALGRFVWLFICAFSVNPAMYAATLFLVGYCNIASFAVSVVLASEMLTARERTIVVNSLCGSFAFGYMILPALAYITPSWRWLLGTISMLGVTEIPCIWWVPESHRWLVQRGRIDCANKLKRAIDRYNGCVKNSSELGTFTNSENVDEEEKCSDEKGDSEVIFSKDTVNIYKLFRDSVMRNRLFISFFAWFVLNVTYYFFSLNTSNLGGSAYINCFLAGAVEAPAAVASYFSMKIIGRKCAFMVSGLISSFGILLTPFAISWSTVAGVAVAMIGKFAITAAYDIMYLYTPEMFPTLLRSVALGACTFSGNVGGIVSPYVVFLGENVAGTLPYLIMAGLMFLTVCLVIFLPETRNAPVPDTIEEARKMKIQKLTCITKK